MIPIPIPIFSGSGEGTLITVAVYMLGYAAILYGLSYLSDQVGGKREGDFFTMGTIMRCLVIFMVAMGLDALSGTPHKEWVIFSGTVGTLIYISWLFISLYRYRIAEKKKREIEYDAYLKAKEEDDRIRKIWEDAGSPKIDFDSSVSSMSTYHEPYYLNWYRLKEDK